jgi:hypothetical protein
VTRPDSRRCPARDKCRLAATISAVKRLAISRPRVAGSVRSSLAATTMACIRNEKELAACTSTMACCPCRSNGSSGLCRRSSVTMRAATLSGRSIFGESWLTGIEDDSFSCGPARTNAMICSR